MRGASDLSPTHNQSILHQSCLCVSSHSVATECDYSNWTGIFALDFRHAPKVCEESEPIVSILEDPVEIRYPIFPFFLHIEILS